MIKIQRHIMLFAAILLWMCAVSGCSKSDSPKAGTRQQVDVLLRVKFSFAATRATDPGSAYERRVNDLRIYIFEEDGSLEEMLSFDASELTGDLLETTTVVMSGDKTFVLTGNEPSYMTNDLDAVTKLADLKALVLTTDANQYIDGLPFVTMQAVSVVKDPDNPTEVDLTLRRAVAKSEMVLKLTADNYCTVEVASVKITDARDRSRLLPGDPFAGSVHLTDYTFSYSSVGLSKTKTTTLGHYLYEHITGVGDAATNRATRITLELLVDGVSYHFPLSLVTLDDEGRTVNDVVRNNLYRMDIEVYPYSIFVTYTIYDWEWDDENVYDKELGGGNENGSFYTIEEWVEGEVWDWELPTGN